MAWKLKKGAPRRVVLDFFFFPSGKAVRWEIEAFHQVVVGWVFLFLSSRAFKICIFKKSYCVGAVIMETKPYRVCVCVCVCGVCILFLSGT